MAAGSIPTSTKELSESSEQARCERPKEPLLVDKSSPSQKWHVLVAVWLGTVFDGMDASILTLVLFPAISELVSTTSHSTVGVIGSFVMAAFMIGWAVGAIVFGILADYIGRTKTMIFTIFLYAACTGLCALSHSWIELAIYRFLVGCGIGGEVIAGATIISEYWQGKSRLYAAAFIPGSFAIGYLIAALLNMSLGQFGWRLLFVVGIVPALLTLYIRTKLKEPEQFQQIKEGRLLLGSKEKSKLTPEEAKLLAFTFPQIFNRDNRLKTVVVAVLASTAMVGYWAVLAWIPAWINQLTGTAAVQERSTAALLLNIGSIISCSLGGSLVIWLGRRNTFRIAFIASFICCVTMFLTVKAYGAVLLVWTFWLGFFVILPFACLWIYVPELFAAQIRGTALGFSIQIGRVLAAFVALVGGQLIAFFGGSYALAGACVSSFYVIGIIASFFMPATDGKVK